MYIVANFTNAGTPATGLTPNIAIYNIDTLSATVATTTMAAVTNGAYKYKFDNMAVNNVYSVWVDGGAGLNAYDRYKYQIVTIGPYRSITVI